MFGEKFKEMNLVPGVPSLPLNPWNLNLAPRFWGLWVLIPQGLILIIETKTQNYRPHAHPPHSFATSIFLTTTNH